MADFPCCVRCGKPIGESRQPCRRSTPASPFCWARRIEDDGDSVDIGHGARLRAGGEPIVPLIDATDPYAD